MKLHPLIALAAFLACVDFGIRHWRSSAPVSDAPVWSLPMMDEAMKSPGSPQPAIELYSAPMHDHPEISADPNVMTGMPCIKGTRITVANVVRQIAAGRSTGEICIDYPNPTPDLVRAALGPWVRRRRFGGGNP